MAVVATAFVAMGGAGAARAQEIQATFLGSEIPPDYSRGRNVSVLERDRPEYQAVGIQAGAFTILPRVETGIGYLDNVFATSTGKQSDGYFIFDPSVTARSDWSRNALTVSAGARLREFFDHGTENENGLYVQADGRVDVNSSNTVYMGAAVRQLYEERSSGGYPVGGAAPVQYVQSGVYIREAHEGGRLKSVVAADFNNFNYDNVPALAGGFIDENNRDRDVSRVSGRLEYGLTPDAAGYGQVTFTRTNYQQNLFANVANRDSSEYRILGGGTFDLTALIRGQVALGYISREYDSGLYQTLSGLAADAVLEYFPTQLTTVTFSARRLIEDDVSFGSSGYFNNGLNLRVDHELLRNLLLNAQVDYERDDYQGVDASVNVTSVGAGARYLVNRSVGLGAAFSYVNRDGPSATATGGFSGAFSFDETRLVFSIVLQR